MTPSPMVTSLLPRVSASAQGALPPAVVRVPATPSVDPAASLRRPVLPRASGQEKREMEKPATRSFSLDRDARDLRLPFASREHSHGQDPL